MLAQFQGFCNILSQLWMIQQEMHGILDAFGTDGNAYIVKSAGKNIQINKNKFVDLKKKTHHFFIPSKKSSPKCAVLGGQLRILF